MDGSVQEHEHMTEIDEWLRKERENAQTVHLGNGDKRESTPKCETKGKANLGKREKRVKKLTLAGLAQKNTTLENSSVRRI